MVLVAGQVLSSAGNNLLLLALFWYVLSTTGSSADLALTALLETLAGVVSLFTGVYVDRWRKRHTMIYSDVVRASLAGLMWALLLGHHLAFPWLLLLFFALQVVGAFFDPAAFAFLPQIVSHDELPAAAGLYQSSASLAKMVGLLGGGAIVGFFGFPTAVLLDGVTFLASVVSLLFVAGAEASPPSVDRHHYLVEWLAGLRVIGRSKAIVHISAARLLANFGVAPVEIALAAWVKGPLHGSSLDLGLVMGALLAAMTLGGILVGPTTQRLRAIPLLAVGLVVSGAGFAAVGLRPEMAWTTAAVVVFGLAFGLIKGVLSGLTLQIVPAPLRGRVVGTLGALSALLQPAGIAVFGALIARIPLAGVVVAIGTAIGLAGGILFLPVADDLSAMSDVSA